MKIVLVTDRQGEAQDAVPAIARRLADALRGLGHEVRTLAGDEPDPALYYQTFRGADVIHLFTPGRFCVGAEKHARQMHIACVAGFYAPPGDGRTGRRSCRRLWRRFYSRFYFVHCPSDAVAAQLRAWGYQNELPVISCGEDEPEEAAARMEAVYTEAIDLVRQRGSRRVWPHGFPRLFIPHPDRLNRILEDGVPWQLRLASQGFGSLLGIVMFPVNKIFLGVRIKGRQNLRRFGRGEGAVTVMNHIHPLDATMWRSAMIGRRAWIISLRHNFAIPMIGLWIRGFGAVSLGDTIHEQLDLHRALEKRVLEGNIVHYFPEGLLLPYDTRLRPFHVGAFALAVQTGRPVLPMVLCQRRPDRLWRFFKRKPLFTLCILPPEMPDTALPPRLARAELQERVATAMQRCLDDGPPGRGLLSILRGRGRGRQAGA